MNLGAGHGAYTDVQRFTLLWQDMIGGLQVLNDECQWVKVVPIPDTFVVNIVDFLTRLSSDRFKSTIHRVYNGSPMDRLSMPFFLGSTSMRLLRSWRSARMRIILRKMVQIPAER